MIATPERSRGVTSSLLSAWDLPDPLEDEQYLKAVGWNGRELIPRFEIDFRAEKLGRPHLMRFGQFDLYRTPAAGAAE